MNTLCDTDNKCPYIDMNTLCDTYNKFTCIDITLYAAPTINVRAST